MGASPTRHVVATRPIPDADRLVAEGVWERRFVDAFVRDAARAHPERTAVVDRERRVTFAELDALVDRAAGMLAALGVGRGEVVSFQLPNWVEAAVLHHASVRVGAVSNPVTPIYREREVGFILRQARSRVLVIADVFRRFDFREMVERLMPELPDLEHVLVVGEAGDGMTPLALALAEERPVPAVEREASDIALLLYTSGTESEPKGVLHSHDTLTCECSTIIDLYGLTHVDRVLMSSPVTHVTGILYGLQLPFMLGTTVVLQDVWDVADAVGLIRRERCSFTVGATPFLHGLVNVPDASVQELSSMRTFACGGADIPPALIWAAHDRIGMLATRVYGSTEFPTATGSPPDTPLDRHANTDGLPIGAAQVRVVDEEGRERAPGVRGAVEVRGPERFLGYLDPALNDGAFTEDDWFRTGDLGVLSDDGSLQIVGRAKDVIVRGGENLSAKEIEDLLFEHDHVDEVAVVGYPDPVLGERVCAVIVTSVDLTLEEVVDFLRERRVATQKLPEKLRVIPRLPKTSSGKVQKYRLREELRAESPTAAS